MNRMLLSAVFVAGLIGTAVGAEVDLSVPEFPGMKDLKTYLAGFYRPVAVKVEAKAAQYDLPLDLGKVTNAAEMKQRLAQSPGVEELVKKNGFAAGQAGGQDDVVKFYDDLKKAGVPVFVTSDSVLHLYHIQFDETLKGIEEREFVKDALALSLAMQQGSEKLYGELEGEDKEAANLATGFFAVPVMILSKNTIGPAVRDAMKEVSGWPERGAWRQAREFTTKYPEIMLVLKDSISLPPGEEGNKTRMLAALKTLEQVVPKADNTRPPEAVGKEVNAELALIDAHAGFAPSPLFKYKEDYSQYVPRGHYTRSENLKKYFKAFMWYGRLTFLLKGQQPGAAGNALISEKEARIQTKAAAMIVSLLGTTKLADGRPAIEVWMRIYRVTAYYVGLADDLTPAEYAAAMDGAFGAKFDVAAMGDAGKWLKFRKTLADTRLPEIYGGTGNIAGPPVNVATEADLQKALAATQGLRLMGQRYIPDSYMMGKLVYPTVGRFGVNMRAFTERPFTLVNTDGGPVRGFPRGLDVMAVLGSDRARAIINSLGDDEYARYDETLAKLRTQFGGLSAAEWNRNLYWSWLYALQALVAKPGEGYPTFMRNDAWLDKQLSAALGSWSQLRHDTILYAKQSYTMMATGMPMEPKMVEGYVEPVPEFYARLLALTRMSSAGLDDMKVLDAQSKARLAALERVVERLLKLSQAELRNEKLTGDDYAFIRSFGEQIQSAAAGVNSEGLKTTLVADVHTDANSQQVLEEGTGKLRPLYVAYPMPDGGVVIGCGPAFSYYEFKHPMADRLTDEKWRGLIQQGKAPKLPEWTATFGVR